MQHLPLELYVNASISLIRSDNTGGPGEHVPFPIPLPSFSLFCVAKRKKWNKGKEGRVPKQKLLKACHQGRNVTVLAILERLEFKKYFAAQPWWPTVFYSLPWSHHFENHFTSPVNDVISKRYLSWPWMSQLSIRCCDWWRKSGNRK